MKALKLARLIGALTVVASTPALLAVAAHAQAAPPATQTLPDARPDAPLPSTRPGGPGADAKPAMPGTIDQKARGPGGMDARKPVPGDQAKDAKKDPMIGLAVFGADGQKVGEVKDVRSEGDGKVVAIHVKTGGFLGFGGKIVAIPSGKFTKAGENVQLAMTSDDVRKLPVVDDKAG